MDVEENPTSSSISITWLLVYTALALLGVHQLYKLTYFWRRGISGPIPFPFLGNFLLMFSNTFPNYIKCAKKYGKVYGVYMGGMPCLRVADADLAKQILIKEFPRFQGRSIETMFDIPYISDSMLTTKGEKWKTSRGHMSPTFSGSKMKQMIPEINRCCDVLMDILDKKQQEGASFEIKYVYGSYVLDCVACCAFGLNADCQNNSDDPFLKHSKRISSVETFNLGILLRVILPFLSPILEKSTFFDVVPRDSLDFFAEIVKRAVELRKESGGAAKKDFLQLMMDAAETGEDGEAEKPTKDADKDGDKDGVVKKKRPMTADELIGQSLVFFFAGYETVSTTLTFVSYALGRYPEVQRKLQEEIDEMISEDKPVGYDVVFKMEYLEKVYCESQRMWPMAFALERTCNQDFTYQGVTIPNGQYLNINVFDIHHNPEYWPEPEEFNPENFSKEARETRHPCAYLPFGAGPRNCVGMRFAILESKIALIRILQKYSFEIAPETQDLLEYSNLGSTQLYPKKGIHVRLVPRD